MRLYTLQLPTTYRSQYLQMLGAKNLMMPTSGKNELLLARAVEDDIHHGHHHADGKTGHHHVHSRESVRRVVNRLSRIEGHIRGVKSMVLDNRPCPDVLVQIAAVRGALDRVARMVLDEHLTECIARAAQEGNIEEEIQELKAALDRFLP